MIDNLKTPHGLGSKLGRQFTLGHLSMRTQAHEDSDISIRNTCCFKFRENRGKNAMHRCWPGIVISQQEHMFPTPGKIAQARRTNRMADCPGNTVLLRLAAMRPGFKNTQQVLVRYLY